MDTFPERADPEDPYWAESPWFSVILERTYFVRSFCSGSDVLDAPCGVGWTSAKIAERARSVLGIDYSKDAIELAKERYFRDNLDFRIMNCLDLQSLEVSSFDVACSIEALEHFNYDDGIRYIDELRRILRPKGILVGTTPSAFTRAEAQSRLVKEKDAFHKYIWTQRELKKLLRRRFSEVWVCPMPDGYFIFWARKGGGFSYQVTLGFSYLRKRIRRLCRLFCRICQEMTFGC